MPYQVFVADCAGVRLEQECATFAVALDFYRWLAPEARRRKDYLGLINADRVDLGRADGLTEEEREAVDD